MKFCLVSYFKPWSYGSFFCCLTCLVAAIIHFSLFSKMKFNKQKRHRRTVRFYTACFGFREPFKVLCDGTFIHHLLANGITPGDKAISNTLRGSVKLFTTRCVIGELRSLGASHAESLKDANDHFNVARCEHEKRINAASCIEEIIGESNSEHFFVATQDAYMRKKLQQIPGVPLLYGLRNALFLEQPSSSQRSYVSSAEEERKHVSEKEVEHLQKLAKEISNSGATGDESIADEFAASRKRKANDGTDIKDKAQFKRKKAKGPNPLSRKKKKNPAPTGPNPTKGGKGSDEAAKSKNRKRKRSRKSKDVAVASSS